MSNPLLTIHVLTAFLSISGFIFRGILHFKESALLKNKFIKIAPHVNDTILILSAILLVRQYDLSIISNPWIQAKIAALFLYIIIGLIAFRIAKTRKVKMFAWTEAIVVFAYIVAVATTKNPLLIF